MFRPRPATHCRSIQTPVLAWNTVHLCLDADAPTLIPNLWYSTQLARGVRSDCRGFIAALLALHETLSAETYSVVSPSGRRSVGNRISHDPIEDHDWLGKAVGEGVSPRDAKSTGFPPA